MSNVIPFPVRIDLDVRAVTAFDSAEELRAACAAGYIPTVRVSADDDEAAINAKIRLRGWLKRQGLAVFPATERAA